MKYEHIKPVEKKGEHVKHMDRKRKLENNRDNLESIKKVEEKLKSDFDEAMGQLDKQKSGLKEQMDMFDLMKRSKDNSNHRRGKHLKNIDSIVDIPGSQQ